jgi:uncharacterized paraquat-inducible protein A
VPWCDTCDRLVDDQELDEGTCPTCATDLVDPEPTHVSWKFRLMIGASVIYLGWRFVQGVQWLSHHG